MPQTTRTPRIEKTLEASGDYLYLKRRGYAEKTVLETVGNRYQLTSLERHVLKRAFFTGLDNRRRAKKTLLPEDLRGKTLGVDGLNQLIVLESAKRGKFVFVATDGFVRDVSSVHGTYRVKEFTERLLLELFSSLAKLRPQRVEVFYDRPVSNSGRLASMTKAKLADCGIDGDARAVDSPDYKLKEFDYVATSDTVIIDAAKGAFDLAGWFLRDVCETDIYDFGKSR